MKPTLARVATLLACTALIPLPGLAWGSAGHQIINRIAAEKLPASLPAFVRTQATIDEVATLGPEEDRLKGAGTSWDRDNDQAHFIDIDDAGTVAGIVKLSALPATMEAYAAALLPANTTPYRQGYLPYAIIDGFERIRKDFAIWRVDAFLATHALTKTSREHYRIDRALRESLTIRDIGDWGHFVADGSQPLHVTIHYNGWGEYPNPKQYSTAKTIHAAFETTFVSEHIRADAIRSRVAPYTGGKPQALLSQQQIAATVGTYLSGSAAAVPALYDLWAADDFANATPAAIDYTVAQLARGATTCRDLIALAWDDSINETVGYPPVAVREILGGSVVPRDPAD